MTDDLPFIEVEPDLALALRICADRNTPDAMAFATMLTSLIKLCRRQGFLAGVASVPVSDISITGIPPPQLDAMREAAIKLVDELPRPKIIYPEHRFGDAVPRPEGPAPTPKEKMRDKGLAESDKDAIRIRHATAEKNANGRLVEKGWFRKVAKEYNRKVSYIYSIVYSGKDYEAIKAGT